MKKVSNWWSFPNIQYVPDPQNTWYCTCQIPNIPARSPIYLPDPQYTVPARSPIYMPDPQYTCQIPNLPARSPVCLPDPQSACQIPSLPTRSPNLLACLLYEILLFNNFLKLIWSCWFHTWPLFYNFLCLWAFLAHLQKSKNKDFWGAIVQKQYVFLRFTVKFCFEGPLQQKMTLCLV